MLALLSTLLGAAFGAAAVWFVLRSVVRARDAEIGRLRVLERELAAATVELEAMRRARAERDAAKARDEEAFRALAAEALQRNNTSFLELARTQLETFQQGAREDLERRRQAVDELHEADDVLHRGLDDVAVHPEAGRGDHEAAADVGQRPPAARHAQAHDVLAGVEELAQGGGAQGRGPIAAHGGDQGANASEALDRRVADGPGGLLAVDAPGYADERVGANAGSGRCGWVLVSCLHGGAARQRRGRNRQDGERDTRHGQHLRARALTLPSREVASVLGATGARRRAAGPAVD